MSTEARAPLLTVSSLTRAYARNELRPGDLVDEIARRIKDDRDRLRNVWLHVEPTEVLRAKATELEARRARGESLPLFGIPFAVKDNIDVAGVPTTAACPAFTYVPSNDATVVARLRAAGALFIGKVNLDQFATGLVGARSPYGIPTNPFDGRMIPGGSSSGSAVAVAAGQVSFALGTDTAGSGRVPAAFNNLVGLKPTRGLLSTTGVVPACQSLDCVSIFALTVADALAVAEVAKGHDSSDPFSSADADSVRFTGATAPSTFRLGVPRESDLVFCDDMEARRSYTAAVARLTSLGAKPVEIDLTPFREVAKLLYDGPWVAERLVAAGSLLAERPDALLPIIRDILQRATRLDAVTAFRGLYRLEELRRRAAEALRAIDVMVVPTAPTIFTVAAVLADPLALNTLLGTYTNFVNLLDLAALAVPAGFRADGLPAGVTLVGPRASDSVLGAIGAAFHRSLGGPLGATGHHDDNVAVAVVGAHLSGLPLNHQLTDEGAVLSRTCRTAPRYRLFALPGTIPPKPGMVRVPAGEAGAAIEVEVWTMPSSSFGRFVARIPSPLCIGTVVLEDGSSVQAFLCESHAVAKATDISAHGGWRAYLERASEAASG